MNNYVWYSEISRRFYTLLCQADKLIVLIITNQRATERRMCLNKFKPAFISQFKQSVGIFLPIIAKQTGFAGKIAAEAVIYILKAGISYSRNAFLAV